MQVITRALVLALALAATAAEQPATSLSGHPVVFKAQNVTPGAHNKSHNATDTSGKSTAVGFVGIAIAAIGFGSNFIVIKKKEWTPGDGMFFQFNMVVGVFITGLLYHFFVRHAPPLQPIAMIGGAGWAIGNACCPFIIDTIGMGLGLSIWGSANMLTGWSSAHFGVLWVAKETVPKPALNVAGALVAVVAIIVYAQVKNKEEPAEGTVSETQPMLGSINDAGQGKKKKSPAIVGVAVACVAGVLFGACFNPAQHAIDSAAANFCNANLDSKMCEAFQGIDDSSYFHTRVYCSWDGGAAAGQKCGGMPGPDLAFSQFCGIIIASFAILVGYGVNAQFIQGGSMYVNVDLIVPGFVSGFIWACAQIGWFVASDNLSMVVSFPIITTIPAILANIYGLVLFGELDTSTKNVTVLLFGICCSATAGILITLSKLG